MLKNRNHKNSAKKEKNTSSQLSTNYSNDDRRRLIDSLLEQSSSDNLGYGEDACPKCGVSGFGDVCSHCGGKSSS